MRAGSLGAASLKWRSLLKTRLQRRQNAHEKSFLLIWIGETQSLRKYGLPSGFFQFLWTERPTTIVDQILFRSASSYGWVPYPVSSGKCTVFLCKTDSLLFYFIFLIISFILFDFFGLIILISMSQNSLYSNWNWLQLLNIQHCHCSLIGSFSFCPGNYFTSGLPIFVFDCED